MHARSIMHSKEAVISVATRAFQWVWSHVLAVSRQSTQVLGVLSLFCTHPCPESRPHRRSSSRQFISFTQHSFSTREETPKRSFSPFHSHDQASPVTTRSNHFSVSWCFCEPVSLSRIVPIPLSSRSINRNTSRHYKQNTDDLSGLYI